MLGKETFDFIVIFIIVGIGALKDENMRVIYKGSYDIESYVHKQLPYAIFKIDKYHTRTKCKLLRTYTVV